MEEVKQIEATLAGKLQPLAVPYRHFVAEIECEAVLDFVQRSTQNTRHPRKLLLFNDLLLVCVFFFF